MSCRSATSILMCVLLVGSVICRATTIRSVKLNDLFKEADLVALIRITSGDSESYPVAVYKAKVLSAFKGTKSDIDILFGPCISYGIGSEYLVFLRKANREIRPKNEFSKGPYGVITSYYEVMYSGFSAMEIEYVCLFEGKEINQHCGYGVRLNPRQIILPESIKTFPPGDATSLTNYQKWARKGAIISYLPHRSYVRT